MIDSATQIHTNRACHLVQFFYGHWLPFSPCSQQKGWYTTPLAHIANNEVANRPVRIEPRVLKRRRHRYPLMQCPWCPQYHILFRLAEKNTLNSRTPSDIIVPVGGNEMLHKRQLVVVGTMLESIYYVITWACDRACAHCYDDRFRPYPSDDRSRMLAKQAEQMPKIIGHFPDRLTFRDLCDQQADGIFPEKPGRVILSGGEVLLPDGRALWRLDTGAARGHS